VNSPFAVTPARLAALALVTGLAGCSSLTDGGDKTDYRNGTVKTKTLEVPPDLTQLARESRYQSQGGVVSAAAAAGAGGTVVSNVTSTSSGPATVAVSTQGQMRVERADQQRWLVVPLTPEQLWPQLKSFWEQRGFSIESESAAAGVMETSWAENRTKLPNDILRNALGKVLGNVYDTGERDRYRTRLERTATGTEIYISHRGLIEIYNDQQREGTTWRARPAEPQLEAEMLSHLMMTLGAREEPARAMVAAAAPPGASASGPSAATGGQSARARAVAGTAALEVDEPFDRAWRRVGLTLDRSGFSVEDRDRAAGVYFVRYVDPKSAGKEEPGWWGRLMGETASQVAVRYRVALKASGSKTLINVLTSAGGTDVGENGQRIATQLVNDLR
jgi:outer membrane protein assembly factor BamC